MIVLAYLDCLKGNLKNILLSQYRNLHLIKVFLRIEQLIGIANSNLNESIKSVELKVIFLFIFYHKFDLKPKILISTGFSIFTLEYK